MADGKTPNFQWWLPEDHINSNQWGGQNNSNWSDADTKVYASQQAVAAIQGQTSTATVSNMQVARTASAGATVTFANSTAAAGQQLRWQWTENTTAEATGNVGSDFGLLSYTNAGAALRTNIFIARSTGAMSFTGTATFSSTLACKSTLGITAATGSDNSFVGFFNSSGTRQGYIGWLVSGDQIQLAADGGPSIALSGTTAINLNGAVIGSSTASFTTIAATSVTAANGITAGTFMTCDNLNATQGAVVITAGSVNANPSVSLKDSAGTTRANFYVNISTGQTIINDQLTGAALYLDPSLNFTFNGSNAYKAGGGSWAATSDERIKDVTGEYELGLEEVLQLRPVFYRYRGNDAAPGERSLASSKQFVGFVAQEVERIMPNMVSQRKGFIDGREVDDLRDVDVSSLVFALVNCVKELKAEIEALKAK